MRYLKMSLSLLFLLLFLAGLVVFSSTNGQGDTPGFPFCADIMEDGHLKTSSDPTLESLIAEAKEYNEENPELQGYRIQLFFSYGRSDTEEKKEDFEEDYPEIATYLIYEQPYFKLRVGNFRSLIEAQALYYELLQEYGNVFLVPSEIELPDLETAK